MVLVPPHLAAAAQEKAITFKQKTLCGKGAATRTLWSTPSFPIAALYT